VTLIIVFLAIVLILKYGFFYVTVKGNSMMPLFNSGDRLLVFKHWPKSWLKRGYVVLSLSPQVECGEYIVKRITGLPNETIRVEISELHEELQRIYQTSFDKEGIRYWLIPQNHYFLTGDGYGIDSRIWGPIPTIYFRGLVFLHFPQKVDKR
jgi:signal peptidase I